MGSLLSSTLLACPVHGDPLTLEGKEWVSSQGLRYPSIQGKGELIPWLFPDPKPTLGEWRERALMLLQHLEVEISDLKESIREATSATTKTRLENLRQLKIKNFEMLKRALDPLKPQSKTSLTQHRAYGYRLPLRQGLLGYFPNLIRDWSPRFANENQILFEKMNAAISGIQLPQNPIVLILGAGGSRLAYDWAKAVPHATVIAFDLNPVLLLAAQQIAAGQTLSAVESSFAPKDPMHPGTEVSLLAPKGPAENLQFVFGDVYALPFADASFDIVITPWLVDIVPRPFQDLATSIARVTKAGGHWLNSGSLRFDFRAESENFSYQELAEVASGCGWTEAPKSAMSQYEIPYLQSEFDAHRRFETVTQFLWPRDQSSQSKRLSVDDRAEWIRDPQKPVPAHLAFAEGTAIHAMRSLLLSFVDGQKNLLQIAKALAAESGMTEEQALDACMSFFDRYFKDRRFRESE